MIFFIIYVYDIYIYIGQYFNYQLSTENIKGISHKDYSSQFMKPGFNRSV